MGGALEHFKNDNDLYIADFFDPYLDFAKKRGINVIKGGLKDITFKPDIIILSHVLEHWNDFESEIQNLINIQKNETINYIELPGMTLNMVGVVVIFLKIYIYLMCIIFFICIRKFDE